jgi:pyridoxine kinase
MSFHGTGDTFASVFAGALCRGLTKEEALGIAVDFTVECIKTTLPDAENHAYGTKFELCLPSLIKKLNK